MSKQLRKVFKLFGSTAPTGPVGTGQITTFGSFAAGTPATSVDPATIQSLSQWLTGWSSAVDGQNAFNLEDMNAVCFVFAYMLAQMFQDGVAQWETGTTYWTGSIVGDGNGNLFVSRVDSNQGNAVTNGNFWMPFNPGSSQAPQLTQQVATIALNTFATRSAVNANEWSGICWSPELAIFCNVAFTTTFAQVQTSPDGITWTSHAAAAATAWYEIAWSPQLGLFCAVGNAGAIMTSPDGTTWTSRTSTISGTLLHVIWVPDLALFVATASPAAAETTLVVTSPDGITWTSHNMPSSINWEGVTWSPELGLLVCVGNTSSGSTSFATSTDGITWTARTVPTLASWFQVAWSPKLRMFCAVGAPAVGGLSPGYIVTSGDGITWTAQPTQAGVVFTNIIWSPQFGCFVLLGNISGTASGLRFSFDGINWTVAANMPAEQFGHIAFSPKNGIFCMPNGLSTGHVYTSTYVQQIVY